LQRQQPERPGFVSAMHFFTTDIVPLLLIFVVFYFLLIRPQQKRAKEHQAKIEAVGKNDEVVTGGGLMGKVTKVADDHVEVELAPNVKRKGAEIDPCGRQKPRDETGQRLRPLRPGFNPIGVFRC
jgi:preprotein translocase subunit YajC